MAGTQQQAVVGPRHTMQARECGGSLRCEPRKGVKGVVFVFTVFAGLEGLELLEEQENKRKLEEELAAQNRPRTLSEDLEAIVAFPVVNLRRPASKRMPRSPAPAPTMLGGVAPHSADPGAAAAEEDVGEIQFQVAVHRVHFAVAAPRGRDHLGAGKIDFFTHPVPLPREAEAVREPLEGLRGDDAYEQLILEVSRRAHDALEELQRDIAVEADELLRMQQWFGEQHPDPKGFFGLLSRVVESFEQAVRSNPLRTKAPSKAAAARLNAGNTAKRVLFSPEEKNKGAGASTSTGDQPKVGPTAPASGDQAQVSKKAEESSEALVTRMVNRVLKETVDGHVVASMVAAVLASVVQGPQE